jgi:hypothetical protein
MKIIKMLIFLLSFNLLSEGLYKDTLVKTVNGYIKIADLKVGDEVLGFDLKNNQVAIQRVTKISEIKSDKYCKVNLFDNDVLVHVDQLIYQNSTWIRASELLNEIIKKDITLYRITTYPDHNFLIKNNFLVHNFAPVILLEAAIEVPQIVQAAGTLIAGFATWFGLKKVANSLDSATIESNKRAREREQNKSKINSSAPIPPEDPENEFKKKHPNGKYEDAPYHHNNSHGPKSRAPIDGQKALDNSCLYKEKGINRCQRRIGISNNQFVVLDETGNQNFHGHVRTWDGLFEEMQNLLIKNGKVTPKGKIL